LEAIQKESPQLDNKYFRNQMTMKYLKDYIDGTFRLKSFPNCNIIRYNYNQGILIVEGCYATIIANKIDANIKANIALGGERSGKTKIKFNMIENSKSEGIFVVEGEEQLLIDDNTINNNFYGIVLVDSKGVIKNNKILDNYTSGLLTEKNTTALIQYNVIAKNMTTGVIIKDPSLPDLKKNHIYENNMFQVQMESHAKSKWKQYKTDNPKIIGESVVPKNLMETCSIF
jgi:parallel beta-helix repeat protein